ncbi:MAG: flagellar protein FlgN [Comamonadaceae bacterium]|jgi:flagellar biosynthesis protein FlgN
MLQVASQNPQSAASASNFLTGLRDEQLALTALTDLLRSEQDALIQGDADRVAALAAEKEERIKTLARLSEQRSNRLRSRGLNGGTEGMQVWIQDHPEHASLASKTWQQLLAGAEVARQINQSNGVLIENKLKQNRLKLAVLQTKGALDGVYGADGRLSLRRSTGSSFIQV